MGTIFGDGKTIFEMEKYFLRWENHFLRCEEFILPDWSPTDNPIQSECASSSLMECEKFILPDWSPPDDPARPLPAEGRPWPSDYNDNKNYFPVQVGDYWVIYLLSKNLNPIAMKELLEELKPVKQKNNSYYHRN